MINKTAQILNTSIKLGSKFKERELINFNGLKKIDCKILYNFSKNRTDHMKQNETKQHSQRYQTTPSPIQTQSSVQPVQQPSTHKEITRTYSQTPVPGNPERLYSNASSPQLQILKSNKFSIADPTLVPKSGSSNSYIGIKEELTQISLGDVKVRGRNQVFIEEVDPYHVPEDMVIRFGGNKELKIVGKMGDRKGNQENKDRGQMQIQAETIQQQTMQEHMQKQFGFSIGAYKYSSNIKRWQRWDIFLCVVAFTLIMPILSTIVELDQCWKSIKAIQEQRMKQIHRIKKKSFQKVLLTNPDFNYRK